LKNELFWGRQGAPRGPTRCTSPVYSPSTPVTLTFCHLDAQRTPFKGYPSTATKVLPEVDGDTGSFLKQSMMWKGLVINPDQFTARPSSVRSLLPLSKWGFRLLTTDLPRKAISNRKLGL